MKRHMITLLGSIGTSYSAAASFHLYRLTLVLVMLRRHLLPSLLKDSAYVKQLLMNASCNSSIFHSPLIRANSFSYHLLLVLSLEEHADAASANAGLLSGVLSPAGELY